MSSEAPPPEEPKPPKPRRRWKRWVFGFLVVLAGFLLWAIGPGIRWGVEKIVHQQLKEQKLSGSFQVKGNALDGIAIHNLSLKGESQMQRVQSDLIKIDWTPSSLREKKIEAITIRKLHVIIDPEAPPLPDKDDKEEKEEPLSETLNFVRELLKHTEISITDLEVDIKDTAKAKLYSLSHPAGSDNYRITHLNTTDHLGRLIHNPASDIVWSEEGFDIDRVSLFPKLSLKNLVFHPDKMASAEILMDGNQLTFTSDLAEAHQLTLDSPTLPIATLIAFAQPDLPVSGTITALEIDTEKGLLNFKGTDLKWEEQELAFATIEASTPNFLSPFDQPINLTANLADQLKVSGTITPNREPLDSKAKLAFTLQEPRIPTITGDLTYDSREAHVIATALDALRVDARYFVDTNTYKAQVSSELKDASILDKNLIGPLNFTLTGQGSVEEKTHSGTLNLNHLEVNQPNLVDTIVEGIITYDWPKKVDIQDLKVTSPEGQIQANLDWQDDILTISKLDLLESGTKLLTATATLPAPLETQSLDDILNSTEPISLTIKSQPLSFKKLSSFAPIPSDLSGVVIADLTLSGSLAEPALDGFVTLDAFRVATQPDLPPLDLELTFKTEDQKLLFTTTAAEPRGLLLNLDGTLPFLPKVWSEGKTNPYDIPVSLRVQSPNLDLARFTKNPAFPQQLSGTLKTDLSLSGTLAKPTLNGFATLNTFSAASQPDLPPLDLALTFKTQDQKLLFTADASEPRGRLLNLDGSLPFLPKVWIENKITPDDSPINLRIQSPDLDLARFTKNPAFPQQLSGTLKTDLNLAGTLANPSLNGFFSLDGFRLTTQPDLPPVDLDLKFKTADQKLAITANVTEPGGPLLNLDGVLPFLPNAWIERKTNPNDSPVNLRVSTPDLDLRRVKPFAPIIQQITGSMKLDLLVSGTISDPQYSGSASARIPTMRIAQSPIATFRDINLNATFLEEKITIQPSEIGASGGTAIITGTVDLKGAEPVFDINLDGRYLLLHRTPDYTFRGHSDLYLKGPLSQPKISGSVQITESLIYKDVEILPFGVPSTTDIPRPNIPTFSKKRLKKNSQKPETDVMDWELDIEVTTFDPILIRGNLARGQVEGKVKVTGTIGDPKTSGTLTAKDLSADLPFSDLKVQTAIITLRPEDLTNPTIDLRGSSVVGQYTVQVYLTGPVQDPNLILTSDPPLPESEIMLLVATGSASSELKDRQVASQKALQYLLEGLRRRNRGKDKSVFQRLLKNSDQIELSLGDTNQFSGRKFSSASLNISDQWDFTTQIDELGQTRALLVFSVRLR